MCNIELIESISVHCNGDFEMSVDNLLKIMNHIAPLMDEIVLNNNLNFLVSYMNHNKTNFFQDKMKIHESSSLFSKEN